jgi:hypothetical protein
VSWLVHTCCASRFLRNEPQLLPQTGSFPHLFLGSAPPKPPGFQKTTEFFGLIPDVSTVPGLIVQPEVFSCRDREQKPLDLMVGLVELWGRKSCVQAFPVNPPKPQLRSLARSDVFPCLHAAFLEKTALLSCPPTVFVFSVTYMYIHPRTKKRPCRFSWLLDEGAPAPHM